MSTTAWETHLAARSEPVIVGEWGETPWGFYEYNEELPLRVPVRTAMCVPVCSLDAEYPQVMLTLKIDRGGSEIPGGHLDPLPDGGTELSATAAARELAEETGLVTDPGRLTPFGYIEARNDEAPMQPNGKQYPPRTFMQFFGAYTPEQPGPITDPEVDGAGSFTYAALGRMAEKGVITRTELQIVGYGVRAVLKAYGIPDGKLRVS